MATAEMRNAPYGPALGKITYPWEGGGEIAALPAETVPRCLSRPAAAKRMRDAEHDDFGDGNTLDEEEGAIGTEDAQRALNLASPVNRQETGGGFDESKVLIRRSRQEGSVPPPGPDDNHKSTDQRSALEDAAASRSPRKC